MMSLTNLARALLVATAVALAGCGATLPDPIVVSAKNTSALAGVDFRKQPIVVQFEAGDVIPFVLVVDGDILATAPDQAAIPVTAKRRFFLRLSQDGLALSLDNVHYGTKPLQPGSFQFGVGVNAQGTRATLSIKTPVH